ncbi:MAG: pantoate--beta-alanine ligase [Candidatus Binataceae bacterium]
MRIIRPPSEMQLAADEARRDGARISFVPTMGFLHEGHLSLMREARLRAAILAVSIFVNPAQFGPGEDFTRYPRDLTRDCALMEQIPVDIVFAPEPSAMYPARAQTWVEVTELTQGLCGRFRPGHFRGVTTIVAKLFNIVKPAYAIFGEKDFQQLRAIQRMVNDLNFDVEIVPMPIVREKDGLAISSRNAYLSPSERISALSLSRALFAARDRFNAGLDDPGELVKIAAGIIAQTPGVDAEYLEAADADTLGPIEEKNRPILLALAALVGHTRLIDNIVLRPAAG